MTMKSMMDAIKSNKGCKPKDKPVKEDDCKKKPKTSADKRIAIQKGTEAPKKDSMKDRMAKLSELKKKK